MFREQFTHSIKAIDPRHQHHDQDQWGKDWTIGLLAKKDTPEKQSTPCSQKIGNHPHTHTNLWELIDDLEV
jgi:hypothetical protein